MKSKALLIKPIPYIDESAASLLIRSAGLNGFPNVFTLCRSQSSCHSKTLISDVTHQNRFHRVLELIGLSSDYKTLAFNIKGSTLDMPREYDKILVQKNLFRKDGQTFCPICLREQSYWRRIWLLRPYTVCLKHQIHLYDHCPQCHKRLAIARNQIHICNNCGLDLRFIPTQSENTEPIQWLIELMRNEDQKNFDMFTHFWNAFEKFDWQSNDLKADHNRTFMSYKYLTNLEQSKTMLCNMINMRMHQEHPHIQVVHFRRSDKALREYINSVLLKCEKATKPSSEHQQRYFKFSETCAILQISNLKLNNLLSRGILPVVVHSSKKFKVIDSKNIEQVLLTGMHKEQLKIKKAVSMSIENLLDLSDIAKKLMVHSEIIRNLAHKGWIKMETKNIEGCVKKVTTLEDFNVFNELYILVGTLAKNLNVNPRNLTEKLRHLGIMSIAGPKIDGTKTSLFNRHDVSHVTYQMITSILNYQTCIGRPSKNRKKVLHYESDSKLYMSSREAAEKLFISPSKVSVLVRKNILKKDEHNHNVIMIEIASVNSLIKKFESPELVTVYEAAFQLNCAINWLHINWIKTGFIQLHDYVYWQLVSKTDIEKVKNIQKEYLTANEASKLLGMHRTHIINLKNQGKIESFSFGSSNSLNLYRRSDVTRLLHIKGS